MKKSPASSPRTTNAESASQLIPAVHLTPREVHAVADALALAHVRIVERRIVRRAEMTDPEGRAMERCEDRLMKTIALLRASDLTISGANGEAVVRLVRETVNRALVVLAREHLAITRLVELSEQLTEFEIGRAHV